MATVRELITKIVFKTSTAGINAAQRAVNNFKNSAQRAGTATQQSMNNATTAQNRLSRAVTTTNTGMIRLASAGAMAGTNIQRSMGGASNAISMLQSKLGPLMVAMTAAFSGAAIKNMADETMNLDNRLRSVEKDFDKRQALKGQLYDLAQDARTDYLSAGDLFFRVNRGTSQFGFSQKDALDVTEIVSKALTLGGASTSESQAAVLQLGQALGSGVLQGDELRSLNENASFLMQEMAKNMGVTIGDLKEMGRQGELTSTAVVEAILKSGTAIRNEFGNATQTIGQSMQKIKNSLFWAVDRIEAKTHIFARIANVIDRTFTSITKVVSDAVAIWDGDTEKMAENPALTKFIQVLKELGEVASEMRDRILDILSLNFSDYADVDFKPFETLSTILEDIASIWKSFMSGIKSVWPYVEKMLQGGFENLSKAWKDFSEGLKPFMPFLELVAHLIGVVLVSVGSTMFRLFTEWLSTLASLFKNLGKMVQDVADKVSYLIDKIIDALNWLGILESRNQHISDAGWRRAQNAMGMTDYGSQTLNDNRNYTINVPTASDAIYTMKTVPDIKSYK